MGTVVGQFWLVELTAHTARTRRLLSALASSESVDRLQYSLPAETGPGFGLPQPSPHRECPRPRGPGRRLTAVPRPRQRNEFFGDSRYTKSRRNCTKIYMDPGSGTHGPGDN